MASKVLSPSIEQRPQGFAIFRVDGSKTQPVSNGSLQPAATGTLTTWD